MLATVVSLSTSASGSRCRGTGPRHGYDGEGRGARCRRRVHQWLHVHGHGVLDLEWSRSLDVVFRDGACREVDVHDCELLVAVYFSGNRDG